MAGDNQWYFEDDLPYDQIIGVVKGIYRDGRYISCEKLHMKIYARMVAFFAVPRIVLRRLVKRLFRPFRPVRSLIRKIRKEHSDDH